MKDIRPPSLQENQQFTLYGPELSQDIGLRGLVWGGEKTWKYILVPKAPGEIVFGPFSAVYFDPAEKKYITKSSDALKLDVEEGSGTAVSPAFVSQEPQLQQNDINYIRDSEGVLEDESQLLLEKPFVWVLLSMPLLANLGIFVFGFIQTKRKVNVAAFRSRKAANEAIRILRDAAHAAQKKEIQKSFDLIIKAFAGYFGDKWNTAAGGLTLEQVRKRLETTDNETARRVIEYLEECEYYRFAGSKNDDKGKIEEMTETGKKLIAELERKLK